MASKYFAAKPETSKRLLKPTGKVLNSKQAGAAPASSGGVDFNFYAPFADWAACCILEPDGNGGWNEIPYLLNYDPETGMWRGHIDDAQVGTHYIFRCFNPHSGASANKAIFDPAAKDVWLPWLNETGSAFFQSREEYFAYTNHFPFGGDPWGPRDERDSLPYLPHCVVAPAIDQDYRPPVQNWSDVSLCYEAHVKGLTQQLPGIPDTIRGTYAALAHPVTIQYLKKIGVSDLQLMPVLMQGTPVLEEKNYWGYNPFSWFVVDPALASNPQNAQNEFAAAVEELEANGISVILDVVYNHNCEGREQGPFFSMKSSSDQYFHKGPQGNYEDFSGTGNSINTNNPIVIALILDSLRHLATRFKIKGFRYDLAVTMFRGPNGEYLGHHHPLAHAIAADPILSCLVHQGEPWDCKDGDGYQAGKLPPWMREWSGSSIDAVMQEFRRLATGNSKATDIARIFGGNDGSKQFFPGRWDRRVSGMINFVGPHDGMTLFDFLHNAISPEVAAEMFPRNVPVPRDAWEMRIPPHRLEQLALSQEQMRKLRIPIDRLARIELTHAQAAQVNVRPEQLTQNQLKKLALTKTQLERLRLTADQLTKEQIVDLDLTIGGLSLEQKKLLPTNRGYPDSASLNVLTNKEKRRIQLTPLQIRKIRLTKSQMRAFGIGPKDFEIDEYGNCTQFEKLHFTAGQLDPRQIEQVKLTSFQLAQLKITPSQLQGIENYLSRTQSDFIASQVIINAAVLRSMRLVLTMMMLSRGTPLLAYGDEIGRTQLGDENPYDKDSPQTWFDWDLAPWQNHLLEFFSQISHIRATTPALRDPSLYRDILADNEQGLKEIAWFNFKGLERTNWSSTTEFAALVYDEEGPLYVVANLGSRSSNVVMPQCSFLPENHPTRWDFTFTPILDSSIFNGEMAALLDAPEKQLSVGENTQIAPLTVKVYRVSGKPIAQSDNGQARARRRIPGRRVTAPAVGTWGGPVMTSLPGTAAPANTTSPHGRRTRPPRVAIPRDFPR